MLRIKSYLGIKQNIGPDLSENTHDQNNQDGNVEQETSVKMDQNNVYRMESTASEPESLERTREQELLDHKRAREERVRAMKFTLSSVPGREYLDTLLRTEVPDSEENQARFECFKCKVVAVSTSYLGSGYLAYIIRREYNAELPFRIKSKLFQLGIISTALFGLATCLLLDVELFGKTGRRVDNWVMKYVKQKTATEKPDEHQDS